ncbi:MAG: recombination regulator RecX [Streptococcaceae bacterium]|jgi:regulatory protein|nr:recombination regulator RecX [Streptococcaceae bacterium]
MKEIKSIRKDKGTQYIVTFLDSDTLKVNEDVLVKFRLHKGMQLSEKEYESIKKEANFQVGFQIALRYLDFQMRSEFELRLHLKQKEIENRTQIIERLKELNYINDELFAQSFVRTQKNTSDNGPQKIKYLLKQKGVAPEVIEFALDEFPEDEQNASALRLAEKLVRKYANKSYRENLQKTRLALMNKGFYSDAIQFALENVEIEEDDERQVELLMKETEKLWHKYRKLEGYRKYMKVKQSLYQKGFELDAINYAIEEVKLADE